MERSGRDGPNVKSLELLSLVRSPEDLDRPSKSSLKSSSCSWMVIRMWSRLLVVCSQSPTWLWIADRRSLQLVIGHDD